MPTNTETRNRVEMWNGTVHYSNSNGRPACGSGQRTHSSWMAPTENSVTCSKCLATDSDEQCEYCGSDSDLNYTDNGSLLLCDACRSRI